MKCRYGFPKKDEIVSAIRGSLPPELVVSGMPGERLLRPDVAEWIEENSTGASGFHYIPALYREGTTSTYVIWFTDHMDAVMFRLTWL